MLKKFNFLLHYIGIKKRGKYLFFYISFTANLLLLLFLWELKEKMKNWNQRVDSARKVAYYPGLGTCVQSISPN